MSERAGGSPDTGALGVDAATVDEGSDPSVRGLFALFVVSAAVFALGVNITELFGEFALDIDLKPFFLMYLPIALLRYGTPTIAVGFGAAIGEGVMDIFEGYELDDPFGFFGYVVGFVVFGWVLHRLAPSPGDRRWQVLAATVAALVQAAFEGVAFLVLGEPELVAVVTSILGNALSHGVLLGAIPLVLLYPASGSLVRTHYPSWVADVATDTDGTAP